MVTHNDGTHTPPCQHPRWAADDAEAELFRLVPTEVPPGAAYTSPPFDLVISRPAGLTCTTCRLTLLQALCTHPHWESSPQDVATLHEWTGHPVHITISPAGMQCVDCELPFDRTTSGRVHI